MEWTSGPCVNNLTCTVCEARPAKRLMLVFCSLSVLYNSHYPSNWAWIAAPMADHALLATIGLGCVFKVATRQSGALPTQPSP